MSDLKYIRDPALTEPADVLLEHAIIALSFEERFVIANRLAGNLGYEIRPRRKYRGGADD